jgi:hypothetical protein
VEVTMVEAKVVQMQVGTEEEEEEGGEDGGREGCG